MKYYDCMTDIGMGYFIYAGTAAWRTVLAHIKHVVDKLEISLESEFIPPVAPIGNTKRDVGIQICENCNNCDGDKKCSRCKKVFYWLVEKHAYSISIDTCHLSFISPLFLCIQLS